MLKDLRISILVLAVMTVLTGFAYPLLVTLLGRVAFADQVNGSIVSAGGIARGSKLVGQSFDDDRFFWGRPSATSVNPYNAAASSGSNVGPTNPALDDAVKERLDRLRAAHGDAPVPVDLVTTSSSGLDPHVSPAAARFQVDRVARARGLDAQRVRELVESHVEKPTFGFLGEPRVNVLALNLALAAAGAR